MMKKNIWICSVATLIGLSSAFAQDQAATASRGSHGPSDDLSQWCDSTAQDLQEDLARAWTFVDQQNYQQAEQAIVDGFTQAQADLPVENSKSITGELIARGLEYLSSLDQTLPDSSPLGAVTRAKFAVDYAEFTINAATEIDIPYYIPYGHCHHYGCDGDFMREFQAKFLAYAESQIDFTNNHLTETSYIGNNYPVVPLGNPKAYLKVAEMTASYVASDLSNTIFAPALACTIGQLHGLSKTLSKYNAGQSGIYPSTAAAVEQTYFQLGRIERSIERQSCHI
jgi:hypothetical protein